MRKRKVIFFTTVIISPIIIYFSFRPQIDEYFFSKHVIFWSKNVEVKFSDYQENPDYNSELNISHFHGFYLLAKDIQTATVRAYFDKDQSWVKDTTKFDVQAVKEFQKLRFDLNEVYARRFNAEIDKIRNNPNTTFEDLRNIGDEIYKQRNLMEDKLYSGEYSTEERVKIWRPVVDDLLENSSKLPVTAAKQNGGFSVN